MSREIDPTEAAAFAEGAVDDDGAGGLEAEPIGPEPVDESGGGLLDAVLEGLLETEPSKPLAAVESVWAPEIGGPRRIKRGVQKMTNTDGTPAVLDITIGICETVVAHSDQEASTRDRVDDPDGGDDVLPH